ncbi:MAG TPA: protein-disulfide reductase DsbD domain-containing protein [Chryseolinea sp.]|nr:protein-disulfide reductase DsbD domain-containing protein [Chryseolinea sp.]
MLLITSCCISHAGYTQDQWVTWNFNAEPISNNEIVLTIVANLEPGWHIYTKDLPADGPQPTRIFFEDSDSYAPIGKLIERGEKTEFYDEIYEMNIGWYVGTVSFQQKFVLHQPIASIQGRIEYLTCSEVCVPGRREFVVNVNRLKKDP